MGVITPVPGPQRSLHLGTCHWQESLCETDLLGGEHRAEDQGLGGDPFNKFQAVLGRQLNALCAEEFQTPSQEQVQHPHSHVLLSALGTAMFSGPPLEKRRAMLDFPHRQQVWALDSHQPLPAQSWSPGREARLSSL